MVPCIHTGIFIYALVLVRCVRAFVRSCVRACVHVIGAAEALTLQRLSLGNTHPETLATMGNLGALRCNSSGGDSIQERGATHNMAGGVALLVEAVDGCTATLGTSK